MDYAPFNAPFIKHFANVPDCRVQGQVDHKLFDILFIVICASIAACDDWNAVGLWAKERESWLRRYGELPFGIPTRFTLSRVLQRLNPDALHVAFIEWMKEIHDLTQGDLVAIDGKTLRRSFDRAGGKGAIHMVSAWTARNRMVLGQLKVEDKSNEITAIPALLRLLELKGALVTIDAMGCQKDIAQTIVEQGGDYALAVKENQPTLLEDIRETFRLSPSTSVREHTTREQGHGRTEIRTYRQTDVLFRLRTAADWPELRSVAEVISHRFAPEGSSTEHRYYISSLPLGVRRLARGIRGHWGIENSLHYVLDMAFAEDRNRTRTGDGAENLATVRHLARNKLQKATFLKCGIKNRRFHAAISTEVLQRILEI